MSARHSGARFGRQEVLAAVLLGTVGLCAIAERATAQQTREDLQELAAAQQAALQTGDRDSILDASERLATAAEHVEAAVLLADGRGGEAADLLQRSVARHEDPGTELLLVQCAAAGNHLEQARAAAQRVSASRDDAGTHMALANSFHAAGDLPDTIAEIRRAAVLHPAESAIHLALGSAFWELNEYGYNSDSLQEFGEAQRLAPNDFLANLNLGAVLSQYRRYHEAEPFLRAAAKADVSSPDPWLQLGANAFLDGQDDAAREALEMALRLTGADRSRSNYQIARALAMLSRLAARAGREDQAAQFQVEAQALQREAARSGAAVLLSESTAVPVSVGRRTVAIRAQRAQEAGEQGKGSPAARPASGEQTAAVIGELRGVIARSLNDAGTALAQERDYARALPFFRAAAQADGTVVPVMRNLGLAAYHQAEYTEAVQALSRALEQTPGDGLVQRYLEEARGAVATTGPK